MIMKVIGVELRKGTFTDSGKTINYNNIMIHALKPNVKSSGESFSVGSIPVSVKIKNDVSIIEAIFGSRITTDDLVSMIDSDYDITFDEKKQVDRIVPFSAPAPAPAASKKGA